MEQDHRGWWERVQAGSSWKVERGLQVDVPGRVRRGETHSPEPTLGTSTVPSTSRALDSRDPFPQGNAIIPTSRMEKLRHREATELQYIPEPGP